MDQQRLKREDVSEEEVLQNDDVKMDENGGTTLVKKKKAVKFESESEADDGDNGGLFVNPLLSGKKKPKKGGNSSSDDSESQHADDESGEGFSSADEADEKMLQKQNKKKLKKEERLAGKRKRKNADDEDDVGDFFANTEIEVVPQDKIKGGSDDESMDSDDMAETRALGKLMLRKKTRNEIIDGTYNRYANHDDPNVLPDWFLEDERKHFKANMDHLLTKDAMAVEKQALKAYNERPSKKVMEAKARKKKRLAKAMNKIKNKASVIAEQQEISEGSKMKQIQKMYKKEKAKHKETKQYVVNRNFSNVGGQKTARGVKAVDRRLKKDKRALKAKAKRDKKGGKRRR